MRRALRIGRVRPRYTRTSRTTYLANECGACRSVFGQWPLFHEALPEALALDGLNGLVALADVAVDVGERWLLAGSRRAAARTGGGEAVRMQGPWRLRARNRTIGVARNAQLAELLVRVS